MAHAHMNDSHAGSSDLGCTGSKLDSAQKARRDSTIRGKFLQTVTSRIDTKRVVVIVLSVMLPTPFYPSASTRAHDPHAGNSDFGRASSIFGLSVWF